MNYQEVVAYLFTRLPMYQRIGAPALKPNLDNTYELLKALDNPHQKFKSVHIAGTNGKGSSAHAIASILQTAGYKTGLYTSPHLQSFTERIRIDGSEIEQSFVVEFVERNQILIEKISPSFFELTVAMAFDYFSKESVDIAVIEVGLGGRLDSTNVITPEVSLITMIGWDHANLLGNSLEKIASEKAGIIKKGIPVVIGADQPALLKVFKEKADAEGARLILTDNISIDNNARNEDTIDILGAIILHNINLDLKGDYFLKNLPGIVQVILVLIDQGWNISDDAIISGLSKIKHNTGLKGRWQILEKQPFTVADVGHNEAGIKEIVAQVLKLNRGHLHIIYGTVEDKEVDNILALFPLANVTFYFTSASVPRSMNVIKLQKLAVTVGRFGETFENVNIALAAAKKVADKKDTILVCGSTFVIAEIENL